MKIAIRYQSRGGNTKEVAEAIAKAAGVTAESIEKPVIEFADLLFVGGGVYKWDIDPTLKSFLKSLDAELVKSVVAFTTAGGMNKTKGILSIVKNRGISVEKETLSVKFGLRNHAWFGGKGHIKLTEKQIRTINEFVRQIIKD